MPPRKRNPENKGLPTRWRFFGGAYRYQVPPGQEHRWDGKKQFTLGKSLSEAYRTWADRIGPTGDLRTIGDLLDRYSLEVMPTKAPKTQLEQLGAIKRLRAVFSSIAAKDFKPVHAYTYRDKRSAKAPTAANRELEVLSHLFTKAIEWGVIEAHPMTERKFTKKQPPPRDRVVTDAEVQAALRIKGRRKRGSVKMMQAYIKIKIVTGQRRADILRLRPAVDFSEEGIYFRPSKTAKSSGKAVVVQWSDLLREAVQEALDARPVDIAPWLFCNRKGECYHDDEKGTANGFDSVWGRFMDRVVAETGTERFQERDLRAKAATDAESLEHARALLAHSSDTTTRRIYRRKAEVVKPGRGIK